MGNETFYRDGEMVYSFVKCCSEMSLRRFDVKKVHLGHREYATHQGIVSSGDL